MRSFLLAIAMLVSGFFAAQAHHAEVRSNQLDRVYQDYLSRLEAKAASDDRPAIDLFRTTRDAVAERRHLDAVASLEILAGRDEGRGEGGFRTWLRLGIALQSLNWEGTEQPQAEAVAAGYGAYLRATTEAEHREALLLLGGLLRDARQAGDRHFAVGRDAARQIYNQISDLAALAEDDPLWAELAELGPEPFALVRVVTPLPAGIDYCPDPDPADTEETGDDAEPDVSSSGARGRTSVEVECDYDEERYTCLVFNRPIDSAADNLNSIVVRRAARRPGAASSNASPADYPMRIAPEERLCLADLYLGSRYEIHVPPSFRSIDGETLSEPAFASFDTPERPPSLGFQRGARVVRATGDRNVMLHAVNLRSAELKIRRIGDLQLMRDLVLENVVGAMPAGDACLMLERIGERIADGSVDFELSNGEDTRQLLLPIGDVIDKWLEQSGRGSPEPYRDGGISLTLHPDPLAAHATPQQGAGVYVLFGRVPDGSAIVPAQSQSHDLEFECPTGYASQWLVITNIGLSVHVGRKHIYAVARALDTGAALPGVRIEFVSRSGRVLAEATTLEQETTFDDGTTLQKGMARIDARLGRGRDGNELIAAMAYGAHGDFTFLDMMSDMVALTDRGFEGRVAPPSGYDAFVAPSRGIFRPEERIEALVLIRSSEGEALAEIPKIEVALRDQHGRVVGNAEVIGGPEEQAGGEHGGGYFVDLRVPEWAPEGVLGLEARIAATGQPIGSAPVDIRFYRPDTVGIEFDVDWSATLSEQGHLKLSGGATAEFLYGLRDSSGLELDAPAANLRAQLDVMVEPAPAPFPEDSREAACYGEFAFGHGADAYRQRRLRAPALASDEDGRIDVTHEWSGVNPATVPLQAQVSLALVGATGRAAAKTKIVALHQLGRSWIGLKATRRPTGRPDEVEVEIVALDERLNPITATAQLRVYQRQHALTWYEDDTSWQFKDQGPLVEIGRVRPVRLEPGSAESCATAARETVRLADLGSYVVEVSLGDTAAQLEINRGASIDPDGKLEPDSLVVWTDATSYSAGDPVTVTVHAPYASGQLLGEVVSRGAVVDTFEAEIVSGAVQATLSSARWPAGDAHVYITAFRHARDDTLKHGPNRAIGGARFFIGGGPREPSLSIQGIAGPYSSERLRDGLTVEVVAQGFAERSWIALAAVDEGILRLTDFQLPDPNRHYFGNRRLDLEAFDTYGRIVYVDEVGGDAPPLGDFRGASYEPGQVVAFHEGIQPATDGRATFFIPGERFPDSFQGRVRFMAWAWDEKGAEAAEVKGPDGRPGVVIRDDVVVRLHPPDHMAPGDLALVPLTVRNIANSAYERVAVELTVSGPVSFATDPGTEAGAPCRHDTSLSCRRFELQAPHQGPESQILVPIEADEGTTGDGHLVLAYQLLDETEQEQPGSSISLKLPVRTPWPVVAHLADLPEPVMPGGPGLRIDEQLVRRLPGSERFQPEGLRVTARLSRSGLRPAPDVVDRAVASVSRLDRLALEAQLLITAGEDIAARGDRAEIVARLDRIIRQITALQHTDGGFVGDLGNGDVLTSELAETAFATDVISRAKQAGVAVSEDVIEGAAGALLSQLLARLEDWCAPSDLYALAILARFGRVTGHTIDLFEKNCSELIEADPASRLLLAAAYQGFGWPERSGELIGALPLDEITQQANTGDAAGLFQGLALFLENEPRSSEAAGLLITAGLTPSELPADLAVASWMARANNAVLALLEQEMASTFSARDITCDPPDAIRRIFFDGADLKTLRAESLFDEPVTCVNEGDEPLVFSFVLEGTPARMNAAHSERLTVDLAFHGAETAESGALVLRQYEPVYFLVSVSLTEGDDGQLAAVQGLPPGFEIVDRSQNDSWVNLLGSDFDPRGMSDLRYSEVQHDRWIGFPTSPNRHLLFGFSVRPTVQGTFLLPPLAVRDLNNPRRFGWTAPRTVTVRAEH